jgi:arabinogalactan oligomer/maltooligosaccharide transport system permease protein
MSTSRRSQEFPHLPLHLILLVYVVVTLYPLLWVFTIGFSGQQNLMIVDIPANATFLDRLRAIMPWPAHLSVSNFTSVFTEQPFARWLLNSAVIAIAIVQVLGLGSTYLGLILVYSITAIPFCVWMLKGYFDTIPRELEESALMDGASAAVIFYRIVLPLAKPAVAVTALFSFMTAWNEYIQAATFMDKINMYTAPVGLKFFVGGFEQQWGYFAAGAIVTSIPIVALFLFLQKYLISGLTAGAVKG